MRRALKVLVAVLAAMGAAVTSLAALLVLKTNGYTGHSDYFDNRDTNSDGALSYEEWMASYSPSGHEHPIEDCLRADFYHADCNQDDILTWREYHDFRFRRQECASAAVPTLAQLYKSSPEFSKPAIPENSAYVIGTARNEIFETRQKSWSALEEKYRTALIERELILKQRYGLDKVVTTKED